MSAGLRRTAGQLARQVSGLGPFIRVLRKLRPHPRILMWHGVGPEGYSAELFVAHLEFLTRYFQVVPLAGIWSEGPASKPKVALTFDDGLLNNYTVAYPILKKFGVPATFYVCPGIVENRQWLWNHDCLARLQTLSATAKKGFGAEFRLNGSSPDDMIGQIKYRPYRERLVIQERIRSLTPGFRPSPDQHFRYDLMSWTELASLDPKLITIGAHSMYHPILPKLETSQDLRAEISGCRKKLEERLSRPVEHFCYPDGAYDERVCGITAETFTSAVTTNQDFVDLAGSRFLLPRIPIPASTTDLKWRMQRPAG